MKSHERGSVRTIDANTKSFGSDARHMAGPSMLHTFKFLPVSTRVRFYTSPACSVTTSTLLYSHQGQRPRHLTASNLGDLSLLCACKVAVVFKTGLCFEQNSFAPFASFVVDLSVIHNKAGKWGKAVLLKTKTYLKDHSHLTNTKTVKE
ncbi:hypothetical protein FB451DRAFT_1168102 [Mycena latifolia]|nr:hypothetical protein FB451DRAFT_1168102 [Mycena latifolia]